MLNIEFTRAHDVPVRFAKSPLWETVACARLIARGQDSPGAATLQIRQIPTLAALLDREYPYVPDCLAPPPLEPSPSFADELSRMRRTPLSIVAGELTRMHAHPDRSPGAAILSAHGGADGVLTAITDEIERVWETSVRTWWPAVDAILEADILTRARRLADGGLAGLFADVSGLRFDARRLTVRSSHARPRVSVDRELLLVPSVLGAPDVFAVLDAPWPTSVYYPARGAARIREPGPEAGDWLEALAGRTRARVLKCVNEPCTTTQLAARLRLAPASASHHLQRLRRAGLIHPSRANAQVVYALTARGKQLLALSR